MEQYNHPGQGQGAAAVTATSHPVTPNNTSGVSAGGVSSVTAGSPAPAFQPDESSKTLYVGNLDQSVNEAALQEIFSQTGGLIESVKIIRDKNVSETKAWQQQQSTIVI
jgi:nucleolysin TIA-1/TIAR